MAERRMFAKTIIDSDAFLDMPLTTQALYFHLGMRADDEGFINNPKKIQRMISATDDDMKLLIAKRFIIPFESGVVVIKHWKIHNYIQKDRFKATMYAEEREQLVLKDNKAYTMAGNLENSTTVQGVHGMDTECIQGVHKMDSQVRLGKDSIVCGNNNYVNNSNSEKTETDPGNRPHTQAYGKFNNVFLTQAEYYELRATYREPGKLLQKVSVWLTENERKNHFAVCIKFAESDNWPRVPKDQADDYEPPAAVSAAERAEAKKWVSKIKKQIANQEG